MAGNYSMIPTGSPNTTWGGGALGGIAQTGISAFQGFQNAQKYAEWWRQLQNQRMMDQFAIPAQAASLNAGFKENALAAQYSNQHLTALFAALKQRTTPQGTAPQDARPASAQYPPMPYGSGATSGEGRTQTAPTQARPPAVPDMWRLPEGDIYGYTP